MVLAAPTPDIVRHLEAYDEDAEVELVCPLPEGMGALPFVEAPLAWIIVRGVVLVDSFTFSL